MKALEALCIRYAKRAHARWWIGARPAVRRGDVPSVTAAQVGLPTSTLFRFDPAALVPLQRSDAAHVLAVAGTTSLVYGEPTPSRRHVADAKVALNNLATNATFLSNGLWRPEAALSWLPLTSATFDCGVIGFDRENAFIFWVEEED